MIDELEQRLERYPADRFPIQHATAQFHLGVTLANAGRFPQAEPALLEAVRLFKAGLPVEYAKSLNALGAVLRSTGRPAGAAEVFGRAAEEFEQAEQVLEHGAARFNLGLVLGELGRPLAALDSFDRARELLDAQRVPVQAAAAARERGAILLALGRFQEACEALEEAVGLARRAGDLASVGAAANALGLAQLAGGRPQEAAESLRLATSAHPKSLRAEAHAMAKANLALAYERLGEAPRARLAALQAVATPEAAPPTRAQAEAVLERLGRRVGELAEVLDLEPPDRWAGTIREEMGRWLEMGGDERRDEAAAWITGQLSRPERGVELAEAWLGAMLELPPEAMEQVIASSLEALGPRDPEERKRFRGQVSQAMARFHVPQWMRLKDTFNATAIRFGQEEGWG